MALLEQLNKRYATKKFDASKKISSKDLSTLLEAIRLSASSYGLQAYKVLVVENEAIRKQLCAAAWDQSQITGATMKEPSSTSKLLKLKTLLCMQFIIFLSVYSFW